MRLSEKKCAACETGTHPFTPQEIAKYQDQVSGWEVIENKKIRKSFRFADFKEALAFTNKVAEIAETEGHHPDILLSWGKVIIELWTHAVGGLSENDFILAAKIDRIGE